MPPGWQLTAGEVEDGIGELVEGGGGCPWLGALGALPPVLQACSSTGSPDPHVDCLCRWMCKFNWKGGRILYRYIPSWSNWKMSRSR